MTLVGGVLPLYKDAVGVFESPRRLSYNDTCWGESYPSTKMQSVYSRVQDDWATMTLVGGVLPLYKEAVGVF